MTIFASKAAFMQLGLEQVTPSSAHMYQDCYICKDPLDVNIHKTASDAHHSAVRISVCGHMHGQECLAAWLDAGNSCPTCKRILFEASGLSFTQADISSVVHVLRRLVGEARVMSSIVRLTGKQELERAQLRRTHEEEAKDMEVKEAQSRQDSLLDDDEWMESGDGEDFGIDEEDDNGGIALDEEDVEPQSPTAWE